MLINNALYCAVDDELSYDKGGTNRFGRFILAKHALQLGWLGYGSICFN